MKIIQIQAVKSIIFSGIAMPRKFLSLQLRSTLFVSFICLSTGAFLGYTSPAILSWSDDRTFPMLSVQDIAWIGSLGPLGALCGCLFTAIANPAFGARQTLLYFAAPCFLLSWFGIYAAESHNMIFISRFLGGFGTGMTTSSAPLYVIGIASIQNRGRLGILPQLLMLFGIATSYCLGSVLSWSTHAMVCCILILPAFILIPLAPDTPAWLISVNRTAEALRILEELDESEDLEKNSSPAVKEFERMLAQSARALEVKTAEGRWKLWTEACTLKCIIVALGVMTFQQLSGINGVTFYAATIFKQNPGISAGPHLPAIILAFTQCLASITSTFIIEKAGRKILLMISAILTSLGSGSLGFYFMFGSDDPDLFWIPLVILIVFAFGFAIGFGPVSWVVVTEILPEEIRSVVNPFVQAYTWLCTFGVTQSFPYLMQWIGISGVFWTYAACSATGLGFVITCLPETKGKTFEELQNNFKGNKMTEEACNDNNKGKIIGSISSCIQEGKVGCNDSSDL